VGLGNVARWKEVAMARRDAASYKEGKRSVQILRLNGKQTYFSVVAICIV
jgi:hypothetical protein